jgi:hypothetical protein
MSRKWVNFQNCWVLCAFRSEFGNLGSLLRIRMFLGLLDPDPDSLVRGTDPDPLRILLSSSKNLDSYCLWLFVDFLSLENDVNVPSKWNKQKNFKLVFCWPLEGKWRNFPDPDPGSFSQRHGSADPDPHQNVMDPQHFLGGKKRFLC